MLRVVISHTSHQFEHTHDVMNPVIRHTELTSSHALLGEPFGVNDLFA